MLLYLRLFKESFAFAINALTNNKLRTFLSLLGVTIGIFSIIAVLAAVDSLDKNIQEKLSGLDNFPQTEYSDFEFVRRNVPDIAASAYVIFGSSQTVKYGSEILSGVAITPVSNEIYEIENIKIDNGRFYTESESDNGSPVVVLGHTIAENLFGNDNPIGKQIRIYGR